MNTFNRSLVKPFKAFKYEGGRLNFPKSVKQYFWRDISAAQSNRNFCNGGMAA